MDRIGLKRETAPSTKKFSYTALQYFARLWDGRWTRDTLLAYHADSGTVPSPDWQEVRLFVFEKTVLHIYGVAYWLGVPPYDDAYPDYRMDLTLWTNEVDQPRLLDFRDGSMVPLSKIQTTYTYHDV
jgi:hypothetical protein